MRRYGANGVGPILDGLASRSVFRIDLRLGRGGCGSGNDGWIGYPPRRMTVVNDRCSIGWGCWWRFGRVG